MAARNYLSDPNTPFFGVDEDDVDDETFLRHSKSGSSGYMLPDRYQPERVNNYGLALEERRLELLQRKKEIEERTVQSSERSLSLLRDSEQIGVATAEELLHQREQLERTEKRLDEINATLRFSQKHIQGIKSVFGSFKNYLSGKSGDQAPSPSNFKDSDSGGGTSRIGSAGYSQLNDSLEQSRANIGSPTENHPGLKIRGLAQDPWETGDPSLRSAGGSPGINKVLDRNLEEMCTSLTRLKGLAQGLGEEIDEQNEMLDSLNDKTDKADFTILRQNKDMAKLLKK